VESSQKTFGLRRLLRLVRKVAWRHDWLAETKLGIAADLGVAETQARTLCAFLFTTVSALRPGFLGGFASDFFDSI